MPIREDVALSQISTFGIGGPARWYSRVSTPRQLVAAVLEAKKSSQPYLLVAGGSNVVFADRGFAGLVIQYFRSRGGVAVRGEIIQCEAGVPLGRLITTAVKNGLGGLEAMSGIPGTVGGAVVGNAGAYGQSISDHLLEVTIFDGKIERRLTKAECRFAYRESVFKTPRAKHWLVLGARFKLTPADSKVLTQHARQIMATRQKKYQPGLRCPGSFFKNVLVAGVSQRALRLIDPAKVIDGKIPAGYLLEAIGAKGLRRGRIKIADFHGNLLINEGGATAAEVKKLAAILKQRVFKKFGIKLQEEVRYLP